MALFSLTQWHHFAYMVVSVALLGFGVSGSFLVLTRAVFETRFRSFAVIQACLFAISSLLCYALAQRLSFNPEELIWDNSHWLRLALVILLLALPFFFAANLVGMALIRFRGSLARIYATDLFGAGIGAVGIIAILFLVAPATALRFISFLGFAAAAGVWIECRGQLRPVIIGLPLAILCLYALPDSWSEPRISPYKGLSQLLRVSGTRVIAERFSPLGLVSVVESEAIPLRHAPGLSLNSRIEPPAQLGLFINADGLSAITRYSGDRAELAYLDDLTSALPYHLKVPKRVLVMGAGGGAGILQALYHDSGRIDAVEINPQVVDLVGVRFADFSGRIFDHTSVRMQIAEARGFLQSGTSRYDLIQIPLLDSFATAAAGTHGLNENYLYTVEALQQAMQRLDDQGYIALTRWIDLPPRDSLKLFASAIEALKASGTDNIERRLVLIRGWQTSTLLIKHGLINSAEIDAIRTFCARRSFDLAYYPGMPANEANRYNQLEAPYFYDGTRALLGKQRDRFLQDYKFNLEPSTDDRPFHSHFVKWSSLAELIKLRHRGGGALLETGYLTLVVTLVLVLLLSILLILLPLIFIRRQGSQMISHASIVRVLGYFFALGLGFLLIEIAFLQKFILLLHHPIYAASVVLGSFLFAAGAGSAYAQRFAGQLRSKKITTNAVAVILVLGLAYLALLGPLMQFAGSWSLVARILLSIALIAPLGFCMGIPFPLGLSALASGPPSLTPWAWGINGCASVISAVLATLLAIHFGFNVVILLALACYFAAAVSYPELTS
ncbi:MAG: SAM-dependent methyltransferase [Gammaproteobacteria bacterium]|nr:MAG: SAM-dependent methyltransferase [Gammaproteobacteria bacterium]